MLTKYKMRSKAFLRRDFKTRWYKKWAAQLNQTESGRGKFALKANKFWQNAAMAQALYERGVLAPGKKGVGFGVGMERLPALFASLGIKVLATDQDYKTLKAASWNSDQLAHGSQSLNMNNICPPEVFEENVSYRSIDMNKVPKDLRGGFDFVWSNCALGHLGSIEKGKDFIIKSATCLVDGGWSVHTTEVNILSDNDTLDHSDNTVFLRLCDIYDLSKNLTALGYSVSPLRFNLGSSLNDQRFTLHPQWGNDHSKLLFNGYMATQIVLIIQKSTASVLSKHLQLLMHYYNYRLNLFLMKQHLRRNKKLRQVVGLSKASRSVAASAIEVRPVKKLLGYVLKEASPRQLKLPIVMVPQQPCLPLAAICQAHSP
jgi:hypothetical protein